ncbi:D-alanyl-D-alanine carboxypeptidase family protein [Thermogemmatispora sp.]|uniref:D-alanyl-D-alanine carboxypeptidase family protein n=1 Tax=Thermogemmatispora sp. TaxID=1968838 RepID=UPI0026099942|nr:D-alanyl-D-alanine carboxypeptidase family protein [Thermogemmatispora sp.]
MPQQQQRSRSVFPTLSPLVSRILAALLLVLAASIAIGTSLLVFTPLGAKPASGPFAAATPTATGTQLPPTPTPTLAPVLTPHGTPPALSAAEAMLLDADSGRILVDMNGEVPRPMASTTKIMTAVIALQIGDLHQEITVGADAVNEARDNDGSNAGLQVGERLTLRDLLYALLLPSGDDAAIAIADGLAGSSEKFVTLMNLFAWRLHLFQTHYANPDGLPAPNHYSTAFDLVRLARYAMTIPLFAEIVRTRVYSVPETATHLAHVWTSTNELLSTYPGATGIKTGFTGEAGYCLVFSATNKGHHLIGVVLHAASSEARFQDARRLLDWGFSLPALPVSASAPPPL